MARVYSTVLAKVNFTATTATEFWSQFPSAGHTWVVRHIAVSGHEYAGGIVRWAVGIYMPATVGPVGTNTAWFAQGVSPGINEVSDWEGRVALTAGQGLNMETFVAVTPKASCTMLVAGYDLSP